MTTIRGTAQCVLWVVGFALLVSGNGKVEATGCYVKDVCKHVEIIKGSIMTGSPEGIELTLDKETKGRIKKKCEKELKATTCRFNEVIEMCWDKNRSLEDVVKRCKAN